MRRPLLLAALVLLLLPAGAHAGLDGARLPDRSLRDAGYRVTWPWRESFVTLAPGAAVTVNVKRAPRTVRLALYEVDIDGNPLSEVARASMRRGRFRELLPAGRAALYALRLTAGRRVYKSWIATQVPSPPFTPPTGGKPIGPPLRRQAAELRVEPSSGRRGDTATLVVRNTGTEELTSGAGVGWERLRPDGSWQPIKDPRPVPAIGLVYPPGTERRDAVGVWSELEPGPHRVVKSLSGPEGELVLTAPFEVLP